MDFFKEKIQEETRKHREKIRKIYAYAPLYPLALSIAEMWTTQHENNYRPDERASNINFAMETNSINCMAINLYLSRDDNVKNSLTPIFNFLIEQDDYLDPLPGENKYDVLEWVAWKYKYLRTTYSKNSHPILMIRAWYSNSTTCRLEPTGKKIDEMELVCE